ncbi:dual oxidase maturation factor 1 [Anabrus simplex]|uniref:dual oxidase maturation factor 1 n=1 Tax=Anabrus simplex TaxID=316456 RepID=UPI0035A3AB57
MEGLFSYSRKEGFPTSYDEKKTAVTVDVLEAGWILAFVFLAFSFYLVVPGSRGMARLFYSIWITMSLFFGAAVIIGNFGQEWEVGQISTVTPYKAGSPSEINATIGMKLGLRSVNITLKRIGSALILPDEIIDYNERFTWAWDQGRFGFGPYAGRLQQEFREAQMKGLPLPILWVADYFVWDGEGLRFGRYYRTAGWYAHIALWSAFPCWLLANILFILEPRYGGYFTALVGSLQLLACILWAVIRNPLPLSIPFDGKELTTVYGSSFWLTIVSGILAVLMGFLVILMDLLFPDETTIFFGNDPLIVYNESYKTSAEIQNLMEKQKDDMPSDVMEMNPEYEGVNSNRQQEDTQVVLIRRSTLRKAQKMLFRKPAPPIPLPEYDSEYSKVTLPEYPDHSHGSRTRLHIN